MRSYRQYCALAKALDVIGDRWTLLIVRELLVRGACRYTDLLYGLPGIATNLLTKRLRDLERTGIVDRVACPPPVATDLFQLTARGKELEAVVMQIGLWGAPLMEGSSREDVFRLHWLAPAIRHCLRDQTPDQPPVTIDVRAGGERIFIETADGCVDVRASATQSPAGVLTGKPRSLFDVLMGKFALGDARAVGVSYEGDLEVLRRVQPNAVRQADAPQPR
jgi:DNA-binding HxlR family transcriptional regulator